MTAPTKPSTLDTQGGKIGRPNQPEGGQNPTPRSSGFGAPAPVNDRQTALQLAVDVVGDRPAISAEEVLAVAEKFHAFLKKGRPSATPGF